MSSRNAILVIGVVVLTGCAGTSTHMSDHLEHSVQVDPDTGWHIHQLHAGVGTKRTLSVAIAPEAGANAYSLTINGLELLRQPPSLKKLPGGPYGNPILYPTPNRVRDGRFTFEGRVFHFPINLGGHHIHGLVRSIPWTAGEPRIEDGQVLLPLSLEITQAHPIYKHFPYTHRIEIVYGLGKEGMRIEIKIENRDKRRLPFGLGFHPFFRILGERAETSIMVPARRHMDADESLLPSGKLRDLDGVNEDLRRPVSLDNLALDDVYWGMDPKRPSRYEVADPAIRMILEASKLFTHMVVYTPPGQDFFCMENQTCSTDAHNLHAASEVEAAHLLILDPVGSPGATATGSLFYRIELLEDL